MKQAGMPKTYAEIRKPCNLWNLGEGKTRAVIQYIESLPIPNSKTIEEWKAVKDFIERRERALRKTKPDDMLKEIGYDGRVVI